MFPAILTDGFSTLKTEWLTLADFNSRHATTKHSAHTWCLPFECTVWDAENQQYKVYWGGDLLGVARSEYVGNGMFRYHTESGAFDSLPEAIASYFEECNDKV